MSRVRSIMATGLVAVAALTAAGGLAACRRGGEERPDWRIIQLYGGAGSVEALAHPTSVEAFRIDPTPRAPEPGVAYCGVHRVIEGPDPVARGTAEELSRILRDPATYDWRHAKGDAYRPTIGLRFTRDGARVDIALDLDSRMLTAHREGRRVGVEDFDAAADRLRALLTH